MSDLYATPSPQQYPEHRGDGFGPLLGVIKDQSVRLREATSGLLRSAGIRLTTLGMTISSSLRVEGDLAATGSTQIDGTLNVDAATTIGGTLGVTGATTLGAPTSVTGSLTVTGPMAVTGTLSLPAGIIDNAALASPVTGGVAPTITATGWSVNTTMTTKATTSIAIPAGFTRAIVNAQASMYFQDSAANGAWVDVVIAGNAGAEMGGLANLSLGQAAFHTRDITGLTGGSITLEARVRASAASSTNLTARFIQIGGSATFFR